MDVREKRFSSAWVPLAVTLAGVVLTLWGVRLDTSEKIVDRSLWHDMGDFRPTGVNEVLVQRVRDVRLQPDAEIAYHSAMNRAPVTVPSYGYSLRRRRLG